ncbi:MAG: hypothetical protein H7246_15710 [Phycisphaerae bacterium]|nr:hypothetical protein [Saprospiraceae bacterium]
MFENNPFAAHTLEILIMLLGAFFIGLWLGWVLWGRLKETVDRLRLDNQSLNVTLDALRQELDALKTRAVVAESDNNNYVTQVANLNRENTSLREKVAYLETEVSEVQNRNRQVETELGLSYAPDTPIADDIPLEIKENVGETPSSKEIVYEAEFVPGPHIVQPPVFSVEPVAPEPEISTPPVFVLEPVALLPDPKPEKSAKQKPPTQVEAPPSSAITSDRDDLTVIEGIGPKIQLLLNQYGIFSYRHLADADVVRLKEILAAAGPQLAMHDPGTWPSQANLAANDQWDTLKSVQGFLKGGKKPD